MELPFYLRIEGCTKIHIKRSATLSDPPVTLCRQPGLLLHMWGYEINWRRGLQINVRLIGGGGESRCDSHLRADVGMHFSLTLQGLLNSCVVLCVFDSRGSEGKRQADFWLIQRHARLKWVTWVTHRGLYPCDSCCLFLTKSDHSHAIRH